ncbi:class I SAM-dependent methyltransferase [Streptomyces tendae]|uniref:class I SAM-dependent methyltransferase n=1 Tax=Streptomyces tendae TaxID=1932 RepID=UPI00384B392D
MSDHRTAWDRRTDDVYGGPPPPWDIGYPQPALRRIAERELFTGHVLDVGCGTGEHALLAAALGHPATGIDLAPTAIALANRKAAVRRHAARFVVGSVFELDRLGERYTTVLDCGLFHNLDDPGRTAFESSLRAVVPAGGLYFMLGFSDQITRPTTPRQLTRAEIRRTFEPHWDIESIEADAIAIRTGPAVPAWLATIRRRPHCSTEPADRTR